MNRRNLVASGAAALTFMSVAGAARADEKLVKLSQFYPYLDRYLMLPAGQRSHFAIVYYVFRDRHPAPDVKAYIVAPSGSRRPIPIDGAGRVMFMPSLAELQGPEQGAIDAPAGQKVGLGLELEARVAMGPSIDVHELLVALGQAQNAINANAGVLSFAVPKIVRAYFANAGPGRAVFADGHAAPLPIESKSFFAGQSYFDAETMSAARTVMLGRAPTRIVLGGKPR